MLPVEMFRIQGFDTERMVPAGSALALGQLAGNSMCPPIVLTLDGQPAAPALSRARGVLNVCSVHLAK